MKRIVQSLFSRVNIRNVFLMPNDRRHKSYCVPLFLVVVSFTNN